MRVIWTDKHRTIWDEDNKPREKFECFECTSQWGIQNTRTQPKLLAVEDFLILVNKMNGGELSQMCKNAGLHPRGPDSALRERLLALVEEEVEEVEEESPDEGDLESKTIRELRDLAREHNVTYSGLNKSELALALEEKLTAPDDGEEGGEE